MGVDQRFDADAHFCKAVLNLLRALSVGIAEVAEVMDRVQLSQMRLHPIGQPVIGGVVAGPEGIAASFRHMPRHEDGGERLLLLIGQVGMPAIRIRRTVRVIFQHHDPVMPLDMGVEGMRRVQLTKRQCEVEMCGGRDLNAAKENHQMVQQRLINRIVCGGGQRGRKVDAGDDAADCGCDLLNLDHQVRPPPSFRPSAASFLFRICRTKMPAPSAPSVTSR